MADSPALVSMKEAARLTSLSRTSINRRRAAGEFPVPVELGGGRIAFVEAEIHQWVRARIVARDRMAVLD